MTIRWPGSTKCRPKPTSISWRAARRLPGSESRECHRLWPLSATRFSPPQVRGFAICLSPVTLISDSLRQDGARGDFPMTSNNGESDPGVNRREFLGTTVVSLLMAANVSQAAKPDNKNGIPYRALGHTGEKVSLVGLGGYHLARQTNIAESI